MMIEYNGDENRLRIKQNKTKLWDNNKRPNLHIIGKIEERNIRAERLFEEIMAGNSPNLANINL